MNEEVIINTITGKLTSEELAILCKWYDDGRLATQFEEVWLPLDKEHNPEMYKD